MIDAITFSDLGDMQAAIQAIEDEELWIISEAVLEDENEEYPFSVNAYGIKTRSTFRYRYEPIKERPEHVLNDDESGLRAVYQFHDYERFRRMWLHSLNRDLTEDLLCFNKGILEKLDDGVNQPYTIANTEAFNSYILSELPLYGVDSRGCSVRTAKTTRKHKPCDDLLITLEIGISKESERFQQFLISLEKNKVRIHNSSPITFW